MPAKLDQHYLVSEAVADSIVAATGAAGGIHVIEIGPGRGVLTGRLLRAGAAVTAVEIDAGLCSGLAGRFRGDSINIINADWLQLNLGCLPAPAVVVSNLPYSVGTPILQRLLDWPGWDRAVLMFQKEVAERILADAGDKKFGVLSLSVRLKADAQALFEVSRVCFDPPPKVDSLVLRLDRLPKARLPEGVLEKDFFSLVKAAFSQKRKMAAKTVSGALSLSRAQVERAFEAEGIAVSARAEEIPLEAFLALAKRLKS